MNVCIQNAQQLDIFLRFLCHVSINVRHHVLSYIFPQLQGRPMNHSPKKISLLRSKGRDWLVSTLIPKITKKFEFRKKNLIYSRDQAMVGFAEITILWIIGTLGNIARLLRQKRSPDIIINVNPCLYLITMNCKFQDLFMVEFKQYT